MIILWSLNDGQDLFLALVLMGTFSAGLLSDVHMDTFFS